MPKKQKAVTDKNKQLFLEALAQTGNVTAAARRAGVDRKHTYKWKKDPEFAEAWEDAMQEATDLLELEARRRATRADSPSDTLLIFMLKGLRPERYRERFEHTGPNGQALTFQIVPANAKPKGRKG